MTTNDQIFQNICRIGNAETNCIDPGVVKMKLMMWLMYKSACQSFDRLQIFYCHTCNSNTVSRIIKYNEEYLLCSNNCKYCCCWWLKASENMNRGSLFEEDLNENTIKKERLRVNKLRLKRLMWINLKILISFPKVNLDKIFKLSKSIVEPYTFAVSCQIS